MLNQLPIAQLLPYMFSTDTSRLILSNFTLMLIAVLVYCRMQGADYTISYDYGAYIEIIDRISARSFRTILNDCLELPYIKIDGITPTEIGFGLLVKVISLINESPEVIIAAIATISVSLRIRVMQLLGAPMSLIVPINIFAIALFETNALRLGIASSVLLLGLRYIYVSKNALGFLSLAASISLHLQLVLFIGPFLIFHALSRLINRSKIHFYFVFIFTAFATLFAAKYLSFLPNEKMQFYLSQGVSEISRPPITSVIALLLFILAAVLIPSKAYRNTDSNFFGVILLTSLTALVMFLNNVPIVGDRAWQIAFIVFFSFFFLNWTRSRRRLLAAILLASLIAAGLLNILYRYPLSNFFSPPLPHSVLQEPLPGP